MNAVEQYLEKKLLERQQAGNLRSLKTQRAPVDFFSNDYLGLATSGVLYDTPDVANVSQMSGSTGSRLLSGNNKITEKLEALIAKFHKAEAALLFNSGYDANVGLLAAISNRHTTVIYDELCHASIIDGIKLGQAHRQYKYKHNDLADLEHKLSKAEGPVIVITESVFSMDGEFGELFDITSIARAHNATLIVDEAHATGVFGNMGEGIVAMFDLQDSVFARIHTFGKALGCHGAVVVGSALLKEYLINFARSFIYTTALPLHAVHTIGNAYEYLSAPTFSNRPLHQLIHYFRACIKYSGIEGWQSSTSPIQALITGGNDRTKHIAALLQANGMQVNPILSPTVPQGSERLRICLHSFNTEQQVDTLFEVLKTAL